MRRWISGSVAAVVLACCLYAIYWQVADVRVAHFSFIFAAAVFAIVSVHWLLELLDLVQEPPRLTHEA